MGSVEDEQEILRQTHPNLFRLEVKNKIAEESAEAKNKLNNVRKGKDLQDAPALSHDVGAGSRCLKCSCPGLDLHFWRKRCKICNCAMEDHDVILPMDHGQIVIGRLFGTKGVYDPFSSSESSSTISAVPESQYAIPQKTVKTIATTFNQKQAEDKRSPLGIDTDHNGQEAPQLPTSPVPYRTAPTAQYNFRLERLPEQQTYKAVTEYAWAPTQNARLVEKYMAALPEDERPIVGTKGEMNRKRKLADQVPLFDFNVENSHVTDDKERETLGKFVDNVKKNVVGIGRVVEVNPDEYLARMTSTAIQTEEGPSNGHHHHHRHREPLSPGGHGHAERVIAPTNCQTCEVLIQSGEVGVQTDHGPEDDTWHPSCFRCTKCNQILADMIYFYYKGKYFCGRHFADLQYPRCAGCDELIFAREYTLAEEKSWHFDHFACYKCDLKLGGHRYITKDDQPHCLQCYMKYYAKVCDTCGQKIQADEKRLNYGETHWHADEKCFQCRQCRLTLIGQKFIFKDHCLFCSSQCRAAYNSNSKDY